jgi:leucine dehydrogenase
MGMKGAASKRWGNDSLEGKRILVQGAGHVGAHLVELLYNERAEIVVSDIHEDRLKKLSTEFNVEVVDVDSVYDAEMDIYAPCALGATLNDDTIPRLKCEIIAGAANNQLRDEQKHGRDLLDRQILYAPDFLINAGGIINCYSETQIYNRDAAYARTEKIYDTLVELIDHAENENITTHEAAQKLAERRIEAIGKINTSFKG